MPNSAAGDHYCHDVTKNFQLSNSQFAHAQCFWWAKFNSVLLLGIFCQLCELTTKTIGVNRGHGYHWSLTPCS